MGRVLVWRVCALGDLILTVPWLRALEERVRGKDLHLICHPAHGDLLKWAGITKVTFPAEGSNWHLFHVPPSEDTWSNVRPDPRTYDKLFLFSSRMSEDLVASLGKTLGDRLQVIPARPPEGYTFHSSTVPFVFSQMSWSMEEIQRLARLGGRETPVKRPGKQLVVGVHPGSGSMRKNWPAKSFAQLLRFASIHLGEVRCVVLKGPVDKIQVMDLCRQLDVPHEVFEPPDLVSLASILEGVDLFVGNDSGVTHLASSLGIPTLAIFGPSDPVLWSPLGPRVRVVTREGLCPPCHLTEKDPCPGPCQRFPSVEQAWEAIQALGMS